MSDKEEDFARYLMDRYWLTPDEKLKVKGQELWKLRRAKGMKQEEFGIAQSRISEIENSTDSELNVRRLWKIKTILGCHLEDIAVIPRPIKPEEFQRAEKKLRKDVETVNTILKPRGENSPITTAYFRTKLISGDEEKPVTREITSLDDLGDRPALVQGVAGQGKSIFLRYLTLQTFEQQDSLPLFFELRSLEGETIQSFVARQLRLYEINCVEEEVEMFFKRGAISLFLDGFDEVDTKFRPALSKELRQLHEEFPRLKIVVSARPRTELELHQSFNKFAIELLGDVAAIMEIVRRYATDDEISWLAAKLPDASTEIRGLLSTPLMVLFLIINVRYGERKSLPETMIAFYKDLPTLLFNAHNKSEGAPKRPITSGLKTHQLRVFFGDVPLNVETVMGSW